MGQQMHHHMYVVTLYASECTWMHAEVLFDLKMLGGNCLKASITGNEDWKRRSVLR